MFPRFLPIPEFTRDSAMTARVNVSAARVNMSAVVRTGSRRRRNGSRSRRRRQRSRRRRRQGSHRGRRRRGQERTGEKSRRGEGRHTVAPPYPDTIDIVVSPVVRYTGAFVNFIRIAPDFGADRGFFNDPDAAVAVSSGSHGGCRCGENRAGCQCRGGCELAFHSRHLPFKLNSSVLDRRCSYSCAYNSIFQSIFKVAGRYRSDKKGGRGRL